MSFYLWNKQILKIDNFYSHEFLSKNHNKENLQGLIFFLY